MDDEIAKEIAAHLAGIKRQLAQIKWLMAVLVAAALAVAWFLAHLGDVMPSGRAY